MNDSRAATVPRRRAERRRNVVSSGFGAAWRASPGNTVLAAVLQLLTAVSALGVVLATQLALTALVRDPREVSGALIAALVILALSTALSGSAGVLQQLQQRVLGEQVAQYMWRRLLRACAGVDLLAWESPTFLDRLERVRNNALLRPVMVVSGVFGAVGGLLGATALTIAVLAIAPLLVPLILVAGVPIVVLARVASRLEYGFAVAESPRARVRTYLKGLLTNRQPAAELRAFGTAGLLVKRHDAEEVRYLGALKRHVRRRQILGVVSTLASAATLGATMLLIVVLVRSGRISLADAGAAAIAARLLSNQVNATFSSLNSLIESGPFLHDIEDFLATTPVVVTQGEPHPLRSELVLDQVTFRYPGQERVALEEATIRIPPGSVVALVGENGSGKTTLAKVAAGLYQPTSGRRTWDGVDLPEGEIRASVSVLFQDFVRYQMSAAQNIEIAAPDREPDREAVMAAARRAGIHDAISVLPQGYDTLLGIELGTGTDLSGGQWQRLALARAFYRGSDLVVLDEPTAAMDPRAEHELFADVSRVLEGRSALLISHRYSSVRLADYIYVLHHGRIVEHGTHDQLMARGGQYAELYTLQAATYLDGLADDDAGRVAR